MKITNSSFVALKPMNYFGILGFLILISTSNTYGKKNPQPVLGYRSVPILKVGNLEFKDLNRNGQLDKYEDWRLSPEERSADLL